MVEVKLGAIIFSTILGMALGSIIQQSVCDAANKNLGSGTLVMKASCAILSIPLDWILFALAIIGLAYSIWKYSSE